MNNLSKQNRTPCRTKLRWLKSLCTMLCALCMLTGAPLTACAAQLPSTITGVQQAAERTGTAGTRKPAFRLEYQSSPTHGATLKAYVEAPETPSNPGEAKRLSEPSARTFSGGSQQSSAEYFAQLQRESEQESLVSIAQTAPGEGRAKADASVEEQTDPSVSNGVQELLEAAGDGAEENPERAELPEEATLPFVSVHVDNQTQRLTLPQEERTVAQMLARYGISYDEDDLLSPAPDQVLSDGAEIILRRVSYKERVEREEIPFSEVYRTSSLMEEGDVKLVQEGRTGLKDCKYVQTVIDGEEGAYVLKEETYLIGKRDHIVLAGSDEAVSPLDFGLELDENGKPLHYRQVFRDQVATGYSARPGALTASGMYAVPGHVAVNPAVIPYGTKLYITTEDGSFLYGCAIAADTGTGLLAGVIDVDLFYETYLESAMNGRKYVEIYVLD